MESGGRLAGNRQAAAAGGAPLNVTIATIGAGIAALVSVLTTFPIRRHAAALGLLDPPNERSSHRVVTPRGGGLAIIAATAVSLFTIATFAGLSREIWFLFGGACLVGMLGAIDDRRGLTPSIRLAVQLGASLFVVWSLGPVNGVPLPPPMNVSIPAAAAWGFSIVWLVAVTNFFNFMDGIDGLAGGQAVATCLGVVVAAWSADAAALAVAVGGASAGFLFHNWSPARIFMGDAGSGFLGFTLAGMPLLATAGDRSSAVLAVAIGLALFLLDPIVTLLRRGVAGKNVFHAHREHLYQRLVPPETPAGGVTSAYVAAALLLALLGAIGYRDPATAWIGCVAGVCAFAAVSGRPIISNPLSSVASTGSGDSVPGIPALTSIREKAASGRGSMRRSLRHAPPAGSRIRSASCPSRNTRTSSVGGASAPWRSGMLTTRAVELT
jgi:Fuc2NAc and GlcNAc transferase